MINWSKVCEVGLKIAVTAITGVVAYFGISKAIKSNNTPPKPRESEVVNNCQSGPIQQPAQNSVSSSLRGAQNTFAKLGNVVGNIATLAENIGSLFRKDNSEQQPYYNESWRSPNGFRRVSDFIMVVPDDSGYDNCYL